MLHFKNGGRQALVTLAVGDMYRDLWLQSCRKSWLAYAERYGLDVIVFDESISPPGSLKKRSLHWEKALVASPSVARDYEALCWLDTDIILNYHDAPNVFDNWDRSRIAVLAFEDIPDIQEKNRRLTMTRRQMFPEKAPENYLDTEGWYRMSGYPTFPDRHLNTGVMVLTPELHRPALEEIFFGHDRDRAGWDQTVLSYEILTRDLWTPLHWRFNALAEFEIVWNYPREQFGPYVGHPAISKAIAGTIVRNSWFAHFNGKPYKNMMEQVADF